jgi:two-component system chemotaxis response regulator CheY
VEDNQAIGDLMRVFLEPAGYEVMVAGDGETAWELINSASVDVLVTDHDIPRLSGCDLVERMRAAGHDLPIVIVFGSLEALARDHLEQHGIANWLLKPYSQPQLLAAVEAALATAPRPASGCSRPSTNGGQPARKRSLKHGTVSNS